jgi:hypothetical protein
MICPDTNGSQRQHEAEPSGLGVFRKARGRYASHLKGNFAEFQSKVVAERVGFERHPRLQARKLLKTSSAKSVAKAGKAV